MLGRLIDVPAVAVFVAIFVGFAFIKRDAIRDLVDSPTGPEGQGGLPEAPTSAVACLIFHRAYRGRATG